MSVVLLLDWNAAGVEGAGKQGDRYVMEGRCTASVGEFLDTITSIMVQYALGELN